MTNNRTASLAFIFVTILLDVIGVGLIIPVLPGLIKEFVGGDEPLAAQYGGYLMALYALMQLVFAPVVGALSDQYGRRPVLLASLFGFACDYILLAFSPNITWLFIGRILAGITGASFTTAVAYIADISAPEDRGKNFGLVGAAFGVGFIIGPLIGGFLSQYGLKVPFFAAAGLTFCNWLYGYFILPESLKMENRRKFDWKRANFVGALVKLFSRKEIVGLIWAIVFIGFAGQVHPTTWPYFTQMRFGWDSLHVAYSLAFVGLVIGAVQGGLIRFTTPKLGQKRSIFIGFFFYIVGFALFSIASEGWMMYAFMIPFGLGGLAGPTLQGVVSSQVSPSEQGELQGGLTILMAATSVFAPLLHTNLFSYFSSPNPYIYFPGAAFLAGSVLSAIALVITVYTLPKNVS